MPIIKMPRTEMFIIQINIIDGDERLVYEWFNNPEQAEQWWKKHKETVVDGWRYADCEIIDYEPSMGAYENDKKATS